MCEGAGVLGLYLDGDASVNTGHVNAMRLPVGQVSLIHFNRIGLVQTA